MIKLHLDKETEFMAWCEEEAKKGKEKGKGKGNPKEHERENNTTKASSAGNSSNNSSSSNSSSSNNNSPTRLMTDRGPETDSEALKRLGLAAFSKMKQAEMLACKTNR